MILIIVARVRDKVMFALRMFFALCILALLTEHLYHFIKSSSLVHWWFS